MSPLLSPECVKDQFSCDNGLCKPALWVCDRVNDCGDWSDENKCGKLRPLAATCTFQLESTSQMPALMRCARAATGVAAPQRARVWSVTPLPLSLTPPPTSASQVARTTSSAVATAGACRRTWCVMARWTARTAATRPPAKSVSSHSPLIF